MKYRINRYGPRPADSGSLPDKKQQFALMFEAIELWFGGGGFTKAELDRLWIQAIANGDTRRRFLSSRLVETYIARMYERGMLERWEGSAWKVHPRIKLMQEVMGSEAGAITPKPEAGGKKLVGEPQPITDPEELARLLGVDPKTGKKIDG